MKKSSILIVAPDALMRRSLQILVQREGFEVSVSSGADILRGDWKEDGSDLIISYVSGEYPEEGFELIRQIQRRDLRRPIILITSQSSEEMAVEALRIGVSDYLKVPVLPQDLVSSINRCLSGHSLISGAEWEEPAPDLTSETRMVGRSPSIVGMTAYLRKVAMTDCTVLIAGETGTGKELAVEFIHRHSPRSQQPLVVINCAAIPDTLLESELFGHERGAFTGAYARQKGAMQAANGGTLFLDEIGDMSPIAQAKILRAIENKEVCPVGGRKSIPINVRFVAASNKDLEKLVEAGKFRADLYYRLNLVRISIPPLRERREDVELLLDHYRRILNRKFGKQVKGFTEEAMVALVDYDWPGNVRELKNLLEGMFINARNWIGFNDFPPSLSKRLQETGSNHRDERNRLLQALFDTNWNKTRAALQLQWSRMTLYRKMVKYQLNPVPNPELTESPFAAKGEYSSFLN